MAAVWVIIVRVRWSVHKFVSIRLFILFNHLTCLIPEVPSHCFFFFFGRILIRSPAPLTTQARSLICQVRHWNYSSHNAPACCPSPEKEKSFLVYHCASYVCPSYLCNIVFLILGSRNLCQYFYSLCVFVYIKLCFFILPFSPVQWIILCSMFLL